jgi:hypothetical protein
MTWYRFGKWVNHQGEPINLSKDPNALTAHGSQDARVGHTEEAPVESKPAKGGRKSTDPRETVKGKDPREGKSAQ